MSHRRFSPPRLTQLRKDAGLSRQDLASAISRSWSSLYGWERGTAVPSAEAVARIADALACSIDDLFEDTGAT